MADDLVVFGYGLDELHVKVGKGSAEWTDPASGFRGDLTGCYFVDRIELPTVHDLDQPLE